MTHRLLVGPTGCGKSTLMLDILVSLLSRNVPVILFDPHRKLALDFIAVALVLGMRGRLFVDDLDRIDKVPMWDIIPKSSSTDFFKKLQENRQYAAPLIQAMAARRDKRNFLDQANLDKYSQLGFAAYQNLTRWMSPAHLGRSFIPWEDAWRFICHYCNSDEEVRQFLNFRKLNERDRGMTIYAAERLFDGFFKGPMLWARTSQEPTVSLEELMKQGKAIIFMGGASDPDDLMAFGKSIYQQAVSIARKRTIPEFHYMVDEAFNYGLIGEHESKGLATLRGLGGNITIAIQSRDAPTPEIARNVVQNTQEQHIFKQIDPEEASYFAESLLPAMDEHKVHHKEKITKQIHLGYENVERVGRGKSLDQDGHVLGHTENTSYGPQAIYGEKTEEKDVYQAGNEQIIWMARDLMTLDVGWRWIKRQGKPPERRRVKLWPDLWHGDGPRQAQRFLEWQTTQPQFRHPMPTKLEAPPVIIEDEEQKPAKAPKGKSERPKKGSTTRKKSSGS